MLAAKRNSRDGVLPSTQVAAESSVGRPSDGYEPVDRPRGG